MFEMTEFTYQYIRKFVASPRYNLSSIKIFKSKKTRFQLEVDGDIYFVEVGGRYGIAGIPCDDDSSRVLLKVRKFIDLNEDFTEDNQYKWTDDIMEVVVRNIEDVKRHLVALFDVNPDEVQVELVEPVYNVVVHEIAGFPMYTFKCGEERFLALIEKNDKNTYEIQIRKNTADSNMMTLTGVKNGKLFKTVLLKSLNDWFKSYYDGYTGRVKFSWGDSVELY
jgi:hypothetical protein